MRTLQPGKEDLNAVRQIEDVFGADLDNPDEVLRLRVHTCKCSDTSDHPPRVLRSETASTSHLRKLDCVRCAS